MRKIGTLYFGIQEKKQQKPQGGLMGMIQNMMSELTGPMDSDEEEDGDQSGRGSILCENFQIFFSIFFNPENSRFEQSDEYGK